MEQLSTAQHVWETLSKIPSKDVAKEKFNNVTYVKWMAAHVTMKQHFPEYTWEFERDEKDRPVHYYPDGTCEVRCRMTVGGMTQLTTLPVYDHMGKPKSNPNSHEVNTAKQRCRVKAMAEFGLFQDMWSEMDLSDSEVSGEPIQEEAEPEPLTKKQMIDQIYEELIEEMLEATSRPEADTKWNAFTNRVRNAKIETNRRELTPWKKKYAESLKQSESYNTGDSDE